MTIWRSCAGSLRALPAPEVDDIVAELRSHVRDSVPGGTLEDDEVDVVLDRLGTPADLATLYARDRVLAGARQSRSPVVLAGGILRWASVSVAGAFAFLGLLTGYVLAASFFIAALHEPFAPDRVGLWSHGDSLSLHLGFGGGSLPPGNEVLGFWIVPIGLAAGAITAWLTHAMARWCVRSLRRAPRSRAMSSLAPIAPVDDSARIRALDRLRGVALLGIAIANVRQLFLPWDIADLPLAIGTSPGVARADWALFHALVDMKFLTLFSLLFGIGFALQGERLAARGARDRGFAGIYLRRVLILALFGIAHGLLLYPAEGAASVRGGGLAAARSRTPVGGRHAPRWPGPARRGDALELPAHFPRQHLDRRHVGLHRRPLGVRRRFFRDAAGGKPSPDARSSWSRPRRC